MHNVITNWAGNYTFTSSEVYYPENVDQLQELVKNSKKLKILGSAHSFNGVADTSGKLISLQNLETEISIDRDKKTVTVGASAKYGQICKELYDNGFAFHNLASLPHISVAGACATATHGSGVSNGNLASAVTAFEFVTSEGNLASLSQEHDSEKFEGAVVNLGGIGAITKLTLKVVPSFEMKQLVYEDLPLAELIDHFDEIVSNSYSVSLFTSWDGEVVSQIWLKQSVKEGETAVAAPIWFGAKRATKTLHPLKTLSSKSCTPQLGLPGPWYERMPHFRMEFTPSVGEELQSEYMVPRQYALAALQEIQRISEHITPLLMISEIRTIAADNLWMSPCYKQDMVAIHFTWVKNWEKVKEVIPLIEERLEPFKPVPHWGKLFTMAPVVIQSRFNKIKDFKQLLEDFDPEGKFRNDFIDRNIFGKEVSS